MLAERNWVSGEPGRFQRDDGIQSVNLSGALTAVWRKRRDFADGHGAGIHATACFSSRFTVRISPDDGDEGGEIKIGSRVETARITEMTWSPLR